MVESNGIDPDNSGFALNRLVVQHGNSVADTTYVDATSPVHSPMSADLRGVLGVSPLFGLVVARNEDTAAIGKHIQDAEAASLPL